MVVPPFHLVLIYFHFYKELEETLKKDFSWDKDQIKHTTEKIKAKAILNASFLATESISIFWDMMVIQQKEMNIGGKNAHTKKWGKQFLD
jgi:hypothetical protein